MIRRYLILDCNYLAHRAKHVFGDLSYKGSVTGVVYGFLKDLITLSERFNTQRFVFCWDSKTSKREEIYPLYKAHRRAIEYTKEEQEFYKAFQSQMYLLRTEYLPTIGFKNIFHQEGYESDDIIAAIAKGIIPKLEEAIIVTADGDLFQCIRSNITMYNPATHKELTLSGFRKISRIHPKKWAKVKAIAGCTTDNVKGIVGVGGKSAIAYLRGELKHSHYRYKNIKAGWKDIVLRNRALVELPFKGTKTPKLIQDNISQKGWNKVTKKLGMKSIRFKIGKD